MKVWNWDYTDFLFVSFDRFIAASILLLSAPAFVIIYFFHRWLNPDGGGFIYKGERMGKDKRSFTMYKIRTLREGSEGILGPKLYKPGSGMELITGATLRKTRLDEFPQFINVLKGDMALVGPRPVRRAIYESECKAIKDYDVRFNVKPGITGLSQFLTPHNSDKRIRARLDRMLIRKMKNPLWRLLIIAWTGICVARLMTGEALSLARRHITSKDRAKPDYSVLITTGAGIDSSILLSNLRLDGQYIEAVCQAPLRPGSALQLTFIAEQSNRKKRSARCRAVVLDKQNDAPADYSRMNELTHYMRYEPVSKLHEHLLERHIFRSTVA